MMRLSFVLFLVILIISGCKDSSQESATQVDPTSPSETPSTQELPAFHAEIQQKLEGYYASLEHESINIEQFFAPKVESFFGKELSREKVGESLENGFSQVENRTLRMDPASLSISEIPGGGYVAQFSGQVSFIRTESREEVHDLFYNQVTFNSDYLITKYESLPKPASASTQRAEAAGDPMRQMAEEILQIFREGTLEDLDAYLPGGMQALCVVRSGAYTFPSMFGSGAELSQSLPWLAEGYPGLSTRVQVGELPTFDCDDLFSFEGTFLGDIEDDFDEVSTLMAEIERADLETYSQEQVSGVRSVERFVTHRVIDTQTAVSFCLGMIDGAWKLLVLDLASYDCSA